MQNGELFFNFNEKVIFSLRSLYASHGYAPYKMSKFEEYDLYARNKDFLISDSVITFTDTSGKLMALKPDVTLSIIKNTADTPSALQKVYYNENVYRISKGNHAYKEIMQAGLECFGEIDNYQLCEVITLAAKSLTAVSDACVLDISHLGLLENVFESFAVPAFARAQLLTYIGEKNVHDLVKYSKEIGMKPEDTEALTALVSAAGAPQTVIPALKAALQGKVDTAPLAQLEAVLSAVDAKLLPMIRLDFSVVNDMNYYSGIVFKGFIEGIPASILSGGQYDNLMQKMNRRSGAVGFAVYLDLLERFGYTPSEYDCDIVLTYTDADDLKALNAYVSTLTESGKSVLVCKEIPKHTKCREQISFNSEVK